MPDNQRESASQLQNGKTSWDHWKYRSGHDDHCRLCPYADGSVLHAARKSNRGDCRLTGCTAIARWSNAQNLHHSHLRIAAPAGIRYVAVLCVLLPLLERWSLI